MKTTRKMLTLLLILAMMLTMTTVVFAQEVTVGTDNGVITINNASIGKDYAIYKLFDATVSNTTVNGQKAISYTTDKTSLVAAGIDGGQWFELKNGNVSLKASAPADFLKTAEFKTWAESFGEVGTTVKATSNPLVFKGIPYGFYYVKSTLGAALSVNSVAPQVTLQDKNDPEPPFDKVIFDEDNNEYRYHDSMIGKVLDWRLRINTTNYIKGEKVVTYIANDILPAGMTLVEDSLKIYESMDNTTLPAAPADNGYTVTYYKDEAMTQTTTNLKEVRAFKVVVPWTEGRAIDGESLYKNATVLHFEYKAYIDTDRIAEVDFTKPLVNKFQPEYEYEKGKPNKVTPDPTDPRQGETDVPPARLRITKFYKDGTEEKTLQGAEFTLDGPTGLVSYVWSEEFTEDPAGEYWKLKSGRYTKDDPNTPNMDQTLYESLTQKYKATKVAKLITATGTVPVTQITAGDGTLEFQGLIAGTYTLTETKAPDGFDKIEPITFTIVMEQNADGTFNRWKNPDANSPAQITEGTNLIDLKIEDKPGIPLPSTGGIGTTIFYVLGAVLVVAAGIFSVVNRRMKKMDNK